jgi:hypothetical protein
VQLHQAFFIYQFFIKPSWKQQTKKIRTLRTLTWQWKRLIRPSLKKLRNCLPYSTEQLRTYIEREGTNNDSHSFYSPMVYIGVAEYFGKRMISFAKNFKVKPHIGNALDTAIVRCIYKHTSVEVTKLNVEDRLEEYTYYSEKYEDATKHSATLDNYKLHIANPTKQEA